MKGGGSALAGTIWNQFMKQALASTTPEQFPEPPPNDATKPVLRGADGGIKLPIDNTTGRIAVSTTPENLIVYKSYLPPHDILYYVNKDDPRGPAPQNPQDDSQYSAWEEGLRVWVEKENAAGKPVSFEEPPTEYDEVGNTSLAPVVNVTSPMPGQAVNSRSMQISLTATAPNGVSQVAYLIDGITLATKTDYPFDTTLELKKIQPGEHSLKIIASDNQGNNSSQEIPFILNVPLDPPDFDWFDQSPVTVSGSDYPRVFYVTPFRWDYIKDIKVYLSSPGKPERFIYTFDHNDQILSGKIFFTWKTSPGPGSYTLRGVMTDKDGKSVEKILNVNVN
jgi:hypothetical protein